MYNNTYLKDIFYNELNNKNILNNFNKYNYLEITSKHNCNSILINNSNIKSSNNFFGSNKYNNYSSGFEDSTYNINNNFNNNSNSTSKLVLKSNSITNINNNNNNNNNNNLTINTFNSKFIPYKLNKIKTTKSLNVKLNCNITHNELVSNNNSITNNKDKNLNNKNNNISNKTITYNLNPVKITNEHKAKSEFKNGVNECRICLESGEEYNFNISLNNINYINNPMAFVNHIYESDLSNNELNKSNNNVNNSINNLVNNNNTRNKNYLITPCNCKGSISYVHHSCLKKWVVDNYKKGQVKTSCEICNEEYIIVFPIIIDKKYKQKLKFLANRNTIFMLIVVVFFNFLYVWVIKSIFNIDIDYRNVYLYVLLIINIFSLVFIIVYYNKFKKDLGITKKFDRIAILDIRDPRYKYNLKHGKDLDIY